MFKVSAFLGLLVAAVTAQAGMRSTFPLHIVLNNGAGYVHGAFADVRDSTHEDEVLECWTQSRPGWRWAQCFAMDDKHVVACWTTDPAMLATIDALQQDGYLFFQFEDGEAECSYIYTFNSSRNRPKTP